MEGYRGNGREADFGKNSASENTSLNDFDEDLPDQVSQDLTIDSGNEAAEEIAVHAINLFMDVVSDPEKMKAIQTDPELNAKFKQLLNTELPAVDINKVAREALLKKESDGAKETPEEK